jgi:hypothetical protein
VGSSPWLPYIAPVVIAAFAYFGGRYQARSTSTTTLTTTQVDANVADRDQLRLERAQLIVNLKAENASIRADRDYWRGIALQALGVAEQATEKATQQIEQPKEPTS